MVLPPGKYDFHVNSVGYKSADKIVDLGITSNSYPEFELISINSLIDQITVYKDSYKQVGSFIDLSITNFFSSLIALRFTFISIVIFIILLMIINILYYIYCLKMFYKIFKSWLLTIFLISSVNAVWLIFVIATLFFLRFQKNQTVISLVPYLIIASVLWIIFLRSQWQISKSIKNETKL